MAAIHDLLRQIENPKLRERIEQEWEAATKHKKFGLVYEHHLPELAPLWKAKPRRGDLVALRSGPLTQFWRVRKVERDIAVLLREHATERETASELERKPLTELVVVKQFGDPIFPTLTLMDAVQNGPVDAPWHALIEADNYHALQLLDYVYAGKVDCIYIDPPYNTGARDWKYNNDYVDGNDGWRHSKWLSFMERRLRLAKRLLKPDTGVLICTIDEHELHHLGNLLEEILPETFQQLATIVINQKGVSQGRLSRVEEYAVFCFSSEARVPSHFDDLLSRDRRDEKRFQTPRWEWLQRGGNNANPIARSGLFYPVFIDPERKRIIGAGKPLPKGGDIPAKQLGDRKIAWPIRRDASYATWQVGPETLMNLVKKGFVRLGGYDAKRKTWTIQYLGAKAERQIQEGLLKIVGKDDALGCVIVEYTQSEQRSIKTVWHRQRHDSGIYGSSVLRNVIGQGASFTFPKSIYSTLDAIATVTRDKPSAIVLDFFAGSGTTLNAVNLLNAADGGKRQCILVTNNEVAAGEAQTLSDQGHKPGDVPWEERGICRSVTWPRSKFTILGRRDDGSRLDGEYFSGRTIERRKRRNIRRLSFVSPQDFRLPEGLSEKKRAVAAKKIVAAQKSLVSFINGLPQDAVTEVCRFIVDDDYPAAVLFDDEAADDWLAALDGQYHITDLFIVTETEKEFKSIKAQVEDRIGDLIVQEDEKVPMSGGFASNLAYYKLDFLDKDRVELGAAFREILPLLWLKAGALGDQPELAAGPLPNWFAPKTANFAVLLTESHVRGFLSALKGRSSLSHIFIVTNADEAFRALSEETQSRLIVNNPDMQLVQLYRDYLMNFIINTRTDEPLVAKGPAK